MKFLEARGIDVSAGVDRMCEVFDLLHDEKNGKILSIDRLREMVEADRDGRLEIFSPEGPHCGAKMDLEEKEKRPC